MPTFGGSPLTSNGTFDPSQDHTTPNLGELNLKAMTSPGALSGTTGIDCKLIHGDRWQEIQGKLTENIKKDLTTHILQKEKWTVDKSLEFTVNEETTDNRVGEVKEYFHSDSRFEYFAHHVDQHHDDDHQINPTNKIDILNMEADLKTVELVANGTKWEANGLAVDIAATRAEAWLAGAEAWLVKVAGGHFQNEAVTIDVQEKASETHMKGLEAKITALEGEAGGPRTIIRPVRIGICIAVHIDSPWA